MTTNTPNPANHDDDHENIQLDVGRIKQAYEDGGEDAVAAYLRELGVAEAALPNAVMQVLADVLGIQPEGAIMIDRERVLQAYEAGGEEAVTEYLRELGVPEEELSMALPQVLGQVLDSGQAVAEEEQFAAALQALKAMYDQQGAAAVRVALVEMGVPDLQIAQIIAMLEQ